MITQFGPNPTNATEKQQTQFECHGNGRPSPTFYIKKVLPAPGRMFTLTIVNRGTGYET